MIYRSPGQSTTWCRAKAKLWPTAPNSPRYGVALGLPQPLTGALLKKGFEEAEAKGAIPGENEFPSLAEQKFLEGLQYFAHTLIKGNVEWGKEARGTDEGDYHDYFEIEVSPALPLIRSRLTFKGNIGTGDFITNASSCPGHNTTSLKVTDLEGKEAPAKTFTTPLGPNGCREPAVRTGLRAGLPDPTLSDLPDGLTTEPPRCQTHRKQTPSPRSRRRRSRCPKA